MNRVLTALNTFGRCSGAVSIASDDLVDERDDEWFECSESKRLLKRCEFSSSRRYLPGKHWDKLWKPMSEFPSDALVACRQQYSRRHECERKIGSGNVLIGTSQRVHGSLVLKLLRHLSHNGKVRRWFSPGLLHLANRHSLCLHGF